MLETKELLETWEATCPVAVDFEIAGSAFVDAFADADCIKPKAQIIHATSRLEIDHGSEVAHGLTKS